MPKSKTNKQIIKQVMDTSPLFEIFVISALESYCEKCIEAGPQACGNALINGTKWIELATKIRQQMDTAYENNRAKRSN